jgi:cell filamentation protein
MAFLDPYIDPATGILRNKLGLRTVEGLREAEYGLTALRGKALAKNPIPGRFDMVHLRAIHRYLFQDVYEWAGKLRTVDIAKDDLLFCRCEHMESWMRNIHRRLEKDDYLRGLEKLEFVQKFTDFHGDMNGLHPFREGNGRATREFIGQLAREAGYTLDQRRIALDQERWNRASAQALRGHMDEMKAIFSEAVCPSRASAEKITNS